MPGDVCDNSGTPEGIYTPVVWWWNTVGGWLVKQVLTDPYLDEIVAVLKSYDPDRIILFGSRARGEADEYSDYDLIVIKRTDRLFLDRLRDMVPYLRQITRPADILVYTPEEFERMAETGLRVDRSPRRGTLV